MATDGWLKRLKDKFLGRTIGKTGGDDSLFSRFCEVYANDNAMRGGILIVGGCTFIIFLSIFLLKKKSLKRIFVSPGTYIVIASVIAPILQVILFRNHSVCHTFSMIKIGWIIALFPIIYALFMWWINDDDVNRKINGNGKGISVVTVRIILMVMLIGYVMKSPMSTTEYLERMEWQDDYNMEEAINNLTDYDDVCFSFDIKVQHNESMHLAVSEKCIYKVENIDEMYERIGKLMVRLDEIYFVIDKWVEEEPEENRVFEETLISRQKPIYEDERYYIFNLKQ